MSAGQVIGTAAAVVGVGVAAAVGWRVFEAARTASQLNTAAGDIRAAGGDQTALDNLLAALRSEGVLSPGREGAAVSQGTNDETKLQTSGVLLEAERAMLAAGSAARLSPNLSVVRPRDVYSNWKIGEGAWLPSQGKQAGWRESPTTVVRGLDMNSYALVYATDVYQPTDYATAIVAYPKALGATLYNVVEANQLRFYADVPWASAAGLRSAYDVFLVSTDQGGGMVALWDPARSRFLTAAESANVQFAASGPAPPRAELGPFAGIPKNTKITATAFIPEMINALKRKVVFQPFPPAVRQQQQARLDATAAHIRAKAGA